MNINTENEERFRSKMKAWIYIQAIGHSGVNFLNRKKLEREVRQYIEELESGEDVYEFAGYFIDSCLSSKAYKTAVFGTISMSDAGAATRLAQDIDEVTRVIPKQFGLGNGSEKLRNAFLKAFTEKIPDAENILKDAGFDAK